MHRSVIVPPAPLIPYLEITKWTDTMEIPWKGLLFWTPRILCLLFAVFLSLFALDVFTEGYGFWKSILALLIHLIPTWIVLVILAVSCAGSGRGHCCSHPWGSSTW